MKTMELVRWGLTLATAVILLLFKMSLPFALLFSAIPFLALTWAINLQKKDTHDFYFVMSRLAVMLALLPSIAIAVICLLTGSILGLLAALPLVGLSAWLVIHVRKKRDASSPQAQLGNFQKDQEWWAERHQQEDRRERADQAERIRQADEAAQIRTKEEFDRSTRLINAELDAIQNARIGSR